MCVISDKIKFCTCVDAYIDIEELNHYWVLNRFNKHKNLNIIGEVKLPYNDIVSNHLENQLKISKVLENQNTFDAQMNFKEKDIVHVVLNNNSKNSDDVINFEFEYKNGNWNYNDDDDPFYLMNNFDEVQSGEIKEIE